MLRRRISLFGLMVLGLAALLLTPDTASAQILGRFRTRRDAAPTYYPPTTMVATETSGTVVTTSEPLYQSQSQSQTRTRRGILGRRTSEPVYMNQTPGTLMQQAPATSTTMPSGTRVAYYPPDTTDGQEAATLLRLRVPAQAEILFDGQKTTQTGIVRDYVTPPLERSSNYSFEIQAKWTENGREVLRTEQVKFLGGQRVELDFRMPTPLGGTRTR